MTDRILILNTDGTYSAPTLTPVAVLPVSIVSAVSELFDLTLATPALTVLAPGATYTSPWYNATGYSGIAMTLFTDVASAHLGLSIDRSNKVTTPGSSMTDVDSTKNHTLGAVGGWELTTTVPTTWVRLRYTNGTVAQTVIRWTFKLTPWALALGTPMNEAIDASQQAAVTKSVINGLLGNGEYEAVTVSPGGALHSALQDENGKHIAVAPFGQLVTAQRRHTHQISFDHGIPVDGQDLGTTLRLTTSNGGSAVWNSTEKCLELHTGTNANGTALIETIKPVKYVPDCGHTWLITTIYAAGASGLYQEVGWSNGANGHTMALNGSVPQVVHMRGGSHAPGSPYVQSSWNVDHIDGGGLVDNRSGFNWNPQTGNIISGDIMHLGYGGIATKVHNEVGNAVLAHAIRWGNTQTAPNFYQISLPLRAYIAKTAGDASDHVLKIRCFAAAQYGDRTFGSMFAEGDDKNPGTNATSTAELPFIVWRHADTSGNPNYKGIPSQLLAHFQKIQCTAETRGGVFRLYRSTTAPGLTGGSWVAVSPKSCLTVNKGATAATYASWDKGPSLSLPTNAGPVPFEFALGEMVLSPGEYLMLTFQADANTAVPGACAQIQEEH